MKIMSYNVATGTPAPQRAADMIKNIVDFDADIVGTQEINTRWLYVLHGTGFFKHYGMIGEPRLNKYDLSNANEYSAIFYKKALFNVIYNGTLWLSDTPEKISKVEGTAYTRIMTYAVMERKDDKKRFLVVNTHVDYVGEVNKVQVEILLKLTKELGFDLPTIFTGDFNMFETSVGYQLMTEENDDVSYIAKETIKTQRAERIIDFVFASKNDFVVEKFELPTRPGSDHDPLFVNMDLK